MKFCEWHRVTRMCRRAVIPHLDMRFFCQVPTSFKIDAHSRGIVSSDNDMNTFVLLIRVILKRRDKFAVPIRASKIFSDEGTYECRSRPGNGLRRILLFAWEMSQNILGSLAYGPGVEQETYRWELERLLALYTDDQSLGEDKNFIFAQ